MMSGIKGRNTRPELLVRSWLHRRGFRFRLHKAGLPGKPDLVFPRYKAVLFVHGCFWHQHPGCQFAYMPASNRRFWRGKLKGNVARDKRVLQELRQLGWRALIIWECETRNPKCLSRLAKSLQL
jgi:DNA mismatch endonuclease (patch repair protein)